MSDDRKRAFELYQNRKERALDEGVEVPVFRQSPTTELTIDPDQYLKKAKRLVAANFKTSHLGHVAKVSADDFYITTFTKTLGNWKAMVSTDVVDDQYWEVTYNGAKKETYVDHYEKVGNVAYPDEMYDETYDHVSITSERKDRLDYRTRMAMSKFKTIQKLHTEGKSVIAIAEILGITESSVLIALED